MYYYVCIYMYIDIYDVYLGLNGVPVLFCGGHVPYRYLDPFGERGVSRSAIYAICLISSRTQGP